MITRLHLLSGLPRSGSTFENVVYDEPDYDSHIGMPGLHTVRQKIEFQERKPCIPLDIFAKYATAQFCGKPELNTRSVTIL